ncbi:D-alanyl-D-alanine carboxypeptidase [Streptomyces sp. NPDC002643]
MDQATAVFSRKALLEATEAEDRRPSWARGAKREEPETGEANSEEPPGRTEEPPTKAEAAEEAEVAQDAGGADDVGETAEGSGGEGAEGSEDENSGGDEAERAADAGPGPDADSPDGADGAAKDSTGGDSRAVPVGGATVALKLGAAGAGNGPGSTPSREVAEEAAGGKKPAENEAEPAQGASDNSAGNTKSQTDADDGTGSGDGAEAHSAAEAASEAHSAAEAASEAHSARGAGGASEGSSRRDVDGAAEARSSRDVDDAWDGRSARDVERVSDGRSARDLGGAAEGGPAYDVDGVSGDGSERDFGGVSDGRSASDLGGVPEGRSARDVDRASEARSSRDVDDARDGRSERDVDGVSDGRSTRDLGGVPEGRSARGGGAVSPGSSVRDGQRVSADGGAEVADGEDGPDGPPAGDDESRTGGAGGESGGDGGAEAVGPVDQATAIFRAPRLPAVDQPTTMLKLGGTTNPTSKGTHTPENTKTPENTGSNAKGTQNAAGTGKGTHDAEAAAEGVRDSAVPPTERTSKFVALKPLDEPSRPKPPVTPPEALSPAEATRALPHIGPERTTQQPLPPKPPLDLLAELTNTPPPPQTPLRTAVRRVKIWTPLVILLVIIFAVVQYLRPLPTPSLTLTAEASYAFEGDKVSLPWPAEGQGWMDVNGIGTMDSFGEQKPVAIGSVAKAMTAYVILKEHPMKPGSKGETIPVDATAETEGGYYKDGESTLNTVKEGDQLTQYDAIAAIMIPSANNIARLLARWDSNGSEEAFVKKMNAAAKELGMKNTTYTDPSGLKETTVSTAEDQVKLGNELVKMKALTDITRLPEWTDPSGLKHRNYNTLVPYDNAIGIKTGSTTAAGGNLLFAATKEAGGETVIVVGAILGQHTPPIIDTVNAVSKTAMVAAQDALTSDTILKKGDVVGYVDDQLGGQTPVVVTKDVSAVGWAGKTVKLELDASETLPHEAAAGTEVGSLIIGDGSGDGVEVPIALQKALTEPGFGPRLTRVS